MEFIRGIPTYETTCTNIDNAGIILRSDKTSTAQKIGAGAYIAIESAAHAALIVGTVLLGVGVVQGIVGAAGATTAAATTSIINLTMDTYATT